MHNNKVFITVFIIFAVLLIIPSFLVNSVYSTIATTLVAIGGGIAIYYQIHKESSISEGDFIRKLNSDFEKGDTLELSKKLFNVKEHLSDDKKFVLNDPITKDDRPRMMAYLTFFETIYLLLEQNVISMWEIDHLFRRRFFKCVMNSDIQKIELVRYYYGYVNVYLLYRKWMKYLSEEEKELLLVHGTPLDVAHDKYWKEHSQDWELNEPLLDTFEKVVKSVR